MLCHLHLRREKKALQSLYQRIGNVKKDHRKGTIVAEEMGKDDFETVNGSRCLLPTGKNIFKILKIHPNNMTAENKNLSTGMVYNRAIEHLRRIDIKDIANVILNLSPEKMFSEITEARENMLNVRKENITDQDFQLEEDQPNLRRTRGGTVFYVKHYKKENDVKIIKSILKKSGPSIPIRSKLESLNSTSYEAVQRALCIKKCLYGLSNQEKSILQFKITNSLKKYHVPNRVLKNVHPKNQYLLIKI